MRIVIAARLAMTEAVLKYATLVCLVLTLSGISLLNLQRSFAQSVTSYSWHIEPFKLRAGESQTHNLTKSVVGASEVTVTSITFGNDTQGWLKVEKQLPYTVKPDSSNNATAIIPISVTIPQSYSGSGANVSTTVTVQYVVADTDAKPSETAYIQVIVDNTPDWTFVWIGIGVVVLVGGGFSVKRLQERKRGY